MVSNSDIEQAKVETRTERDGHVERSKLKNCCLGSLRNCYDLSNWDKRKVLLFD